MFYDHFAGIKFRLGMAIALNIAGCVSTFKGFNKKVIQ